MKVMSEAEAERRRIVGQIRGYVHDVKAKAQLCIDGQPPSGKFSGRPPQKELGHMWLLFAAELQAVSELIEKGPDARPTSKWQTRYDPPTSWNMLDSSILEDE
jgi:hypothetical protein